MAERSEDILPLAERYLETLENKLRLSAEASAKLLEYDWPGNVRELHNRLQRTSLVCNGELITAADLGLSKVPLADASEPAADSGERAQLQAALARAQGVVSQAAVELGLSRQALYRRMERLGLSISKRVD
ncbi:MAG TPA: helix-turn-helix domain-containing protein [Polyangiales bacterium]|nr:helix-turn-helix domain-containing protein [Polyangiales bacterium]